MPLPVLLVPLLVGAGSSAAIDAGMQVLLSKMGSQRPFSWGSLGVSAALGLIPGGIYAAHSVRAIPASKAASQAYAASRKAQQEFRSSANRGLDGLRLHEAVFTPGGASEAIVLRNSPGAAAALQRAQAAGRAHSEAWRTASHLDDQRHLATTVAATAVASTVAVGETGLGMYDISRERPVARGMTGAVHQAAYDLRREGAITRNAPATRGMSRALAGE